MHIERGEQAKRQNNCWSSCCCWWSAKNIDYRDNTAKHFHSAPNKRRFCFSSFASRHSPLVHTMSKPPIFSCIIKNMRKQWGLKITQPCPEKLLLNASILIIMQTLKKTFPWPSRISRDPMQWWTNDIVLSIITESSVWTLNCREIFKKNKSRI